jgi:hypothetical protein
MRFIKDVALIHREESCLSWPYSRDSYGYGNIWHESRMQPVHRVVCEYVHGAAPTPKHEVAHNCGKGHEGCVNPGHLRWATHRENMDDQYVHGTRFR